MPKAKSAHYKRRVAMLKDKSPQESFYGSYLFDKIVPQDYSASSRRQAFLL
jgi:hypothetical protein